jgi:hypothetical protein
VKREGKAKKEGRKEGRKVKREGKAKREGRKGGDEGVVVKVVAAWQT